MENNIRKTIFVLVASAFALNGCGNGEADEAKKLGFSSVEEMKEAHSKGWHTQQQYYKDNPDVALKATERKASAMKAKATEKKDLAANQANLNDDIPDPSKPVIANSISATYDKVDSMILALKFSSNPFEIRENNIGKSYETSIFADKFIDEGTYARVLDGNTGFFCLMKGSDYGKHNQRGVMVVRGVLAEAQSIGIGLDNCTYVSNDINWKPN